MAFYKTTVIKEMDYWHKDRDTVPYSSVEQNRPSRNTIYIYNVTNEWILVVQVVDCSGCYCCLAPFILHSLYCFVPWPPASMCLILMACPCDFFSENWPWATGASSSADAEKQVPGS